MADKPWSGQADSVDFKLTDELLLLRTGTNPKAKGSYLVTLFNNNLDGAKVKLAYEGEVKAFTDSLFEKLGGIEPGAEVNIIESVVDDPTPQAGGNFDFQGNNIDDAGEAEMDLQEFITEKEPSSYDLANTTFASKSFSVNSEDNAPGALFVRCDETKMYMASGANQTIFQYSITAGDINTGIFDNISLDVSNEATAVLLGLSMKPDMSIILAYDGGTDKVFQYNNSDPDDISGAVFSGKSFDFTGQTTGISGIYVTKDGQFLFAADNSNGLIRRYSFGTPWQVDTLSHDNKSLDFSSEGSAARGVSVSDDGRKVFVIQEGGISKVFQYTLNDAFDTGTGSYDGVFLDISSEGIIPTDLFFSDNGRILYTSDRSSGVGVFFQYEHSVSDVSTPSAGQQKVFARKNSGIFVIDEYGVEKELTNAGLENLEEDFNPKLGGNLDLNGNVIIDHVKGVDIAALNIAQEWTKAQNFNATALTALGVDLVTNGDFGADTDWTKGTGWSIAAGVASSDGTQAGDADLTQALSLVNGQTYEVEFTISNYTTGNVTPVAGDVEGTDRAANGTFTENIVAGAGGDIDLRADLNFIGDIDNVTVRLANVSWNLDDNQNTTLTLDGNLVIDDPTNMKDGGKYIMLLKQDGVGSRTVIWGAAYKWIGATPPTLSTGTNDVDKIEFYSDGTNMYGDPKLDYG